MLTVSFFLSDEDSAFPTSKSSQISETASSVSEENSQVEPDGAFPFDIVSSCPIQISVQWRFTHRTFFVLAAPRPPPRPHVFLPSYNSTPRRTPPDSPPRRYASVSPPRRHSISVTSMNMFNDRSSGFSSQHSSPFDPPSQTGSLITPQELAILNVKHLNVNAALFSNQHILQLFGQDMLQFHCHLVVNIKIYCCSTGPKSELFVCLLGSDLWSLCLTRNHK